MMPFRVAPSTSLPNSGVSHPISRDPAGKMPQSPSTPWGLGSYFRCLCPRNSYINIAH